ncbi:MAG: DNA-binding protein [Gammaproteobacteria bacterium]|nr:DNA-binding protein [Gammaproteobacteria bacterium]
MPHRQTIATLRLERHEVRQGFALRRLWAQHQRPRTRADCIDGPRPCPWAGCRYHLAVDVRPSTGGLCLHFGPDDWDQSADTCALDVADRGPQTLEDVASLFNLTRERVRQIEFRALRRLQAALTRDPLLR